MPLLFRARGTTRESLIEGAKQKHTQREGLYDLRIRCRGVELNNKAGIIEALCNACRTLVLNHSAKRAQPVAIEAVRQSRYVIFFKKILPFNLWNPIPWMQHLTSASNFIGNNFRIYFCY